MADRKPFLLRIDRAVLEAVQRWADDDLRSLNGQIEFLLRRALKEAGREDRQPEATGPATVTAPAIEAREVGQRLTLRLFVLFFVGRKQAGGRAERLAVIEQRQVADVQGERAPGPFRSMTTVTGLPSTPSRKLMRQPQARCACVNPFNILW